MEPPSGLVPQGTSELGVDIVKVDRIAAAIDRFGARFANRVLTEREQRYVRMRPETFAGRWAAKEAVSKVLGLGVRGVGWKGIEGGRLPSGWRGPRPGPRRSCSTAAPRVAPSSSG